MKAIKASTAAQTLVGAGKSTGFLKRRLKAARAFGETVMNSKVAKGGRAASRGGDILELSGDSCYKAISEEPDRICPEL